LAQAPGASTSGAPGTPDFRSLDFWGTFFDSVNPSKANSRGHHKNGLFREKEVRYLYYSSAGLKYTDQIEKKDLADFAGDVSVNISLSQLHLSQEDQDAFRRLKSSQLRLDCVQTKPFMNILPPLAWTALASLYPNKAGHLPSLSELGFHTPNASGGVTKVILPGGTGKMAMNISMMKRDSVLHTVLQDMAKGAKILTPFLGLPAISVPALQAFTDIFSLLEERTLFLMNSPLLPVVATQQAVDDPELPAGYVPLVNGDYLLLPASQAPALKDKLAQLEIRQGYLVEKDKNTTMPVDSRASAASLAAFTYVSLKVAVSQVTTPSESSKSSSDGTQPTKSTKGPSKKKQ
jgi:hypothetical protein